MYKKRGYHKGKRVWHHPQKKDFFSRNKHWMATATLIGTIIGAGILAIPYVVAQSGFFIGSIIIILVGLALMLTNLFVGEIVLRTKEQHQLTGYVEKYLGKWGKRLMALAFLFSLTGALTAYLIGEGETLRAIFGWGTPLFYSLLFFAVGSFIIYRGIKAAGRAETILIVLLIVTIILIGVFSFKNINTANLTTISLAKFFVPYGVVFFAFSGFSAVPEMQEVLEKEKRRMRKSILIGSIIPIFVYLLFALFVVGIVGLSNFEQLADNQRIATIALSIYSSPILGTFANVLAVLTMFTSFLTIGLALVETYEFDFHLRRQIALLLAFLIPLAIILLGLSSFGAIIGITGAVAGGLDGILIILTFWKARKYGNRKPEYSLKYSYKILGTILILMFAAGIAYQIFENFF